MATTENLLPEKRQRFVEEYMLDLNATRAAIRAGYSPKTAESQGSRLLSNAKIQEAVRNAQQSRQERTRVTADRTVREIARLAFVDPRRLVNEDGSFKGLHELDEDLAAAVSSIEVDEYGKVKYKLWSKNQALDMLMKHLGLYERDNSQKPPAVIQEIRLVALRPTDSNDG